MSLLRGSLWLLLAVAGLVGWLVTFPAAPAQAWRALLVNFLFFSCLAAGLVTWSPIVLLSHGRWAGDVERLTAAGMSFAVPSIVILALLWYGSPTWAPWPAATVDRGWWQLPAAVFIRDIVCLGIFWIMAYYYLKRRSLGYGRVIGAWTIIAFCTVFTILGFDLVMGMDTVWYSSLLGGYVFISGLYIAVCAWAVLAVLVERRDPDRFHDLGKLIFAFSILTTYMMFSQLLPIWYENLPKEIHYAVPRVNFRPWSVVSWCIVGIAWLGPLVLFLTIRSKRSPWLLAPISLLILVAMWVERWWLVAPSFQRELDFGWSEISMCCALLGIFGFGVYWSIWRGLPPLPYGDES